MPSNCPECGHEHTVTVDAQIEGRGAARTFAIVECNSCGLLWGETREWYGVI